MDQPFSSSAGMPSRKHICTDSNLASYDIYIKLHTMVNASYYGLKYKFSMIREEVVVCISVFGDIIIKCVGARHVIL